mgnify:CR=1 FL=1
MSKKRKKKESLPRLIIESLNRNWGAINWDCQSYRSSQIGDGAKAPILNRSIAHLGRNEKKLNSEKLFLLFAIVYFVASDKKYLFIHFSYF